MQHLKLLKEIRIQEELVFSGLPDPARLLELSFIISIFSTNYVTSPRRQKSADRQLMSSYLLVESSGMKRDVSVGTDKK